MPNGNVVKFSDTNMKQFTIGDPMTFPIVKMGNKKPQNIPFPLHDVEPRYNTAMPRPTHAPPQTAAPTVEALSHTYAVKSLLVTMSRPNSPPKAPLPVDRSPNLPHPWTRPTYDGIRIRSAVFPQCTGQTDAQTDRSSTKKFDDYSPLRL